MVKAARLTLICHALTSAQKVGYFPSPDERILPVAEWPSLPACNGFLSAPECRAQETCAGLGAGSVVEPALADCDMGAWQGVTLKALQAEQPEALAQWLQDPHCAPPGGESVAHLCQRVAAWLEAFDTPGAWVAVTHPLVMRAAMVHVLGCPLAAFALIDVPALSRVHLSRAGKWRLRLG